VAHSAAQAGSTSRSEAATSAIVTRWPESTTAIV
jgi:hypothetical protein